CARGVAAASRAGRAARRVLRSDGLNGPPCRRPGSPSPPSTRRPVRRSSRRRGCVRVLDVLVEPFQLFPQYVLDAFPGTVAVVLERQKNQPRGAARSAYRFEEDFTLVSERAGVGVVLAVDDEHRLVDLVGVEGG